MAARAGRGLCPVVWGKNEKEKGILISFGNFWHLHPHLRLFLHLHLQLHLHVINYFYIYIHIHIAILAQLLAAFVPLALTPQWRAAAICRWSVPGCSELAVRSCRSCGEMPKTKAQEKQRMSCTV